MSRFFSSRHSTLSPYVPGEQPKDMLYIKLNTNESPFPPSENVSFATLNESKLLHLYSDPQSSVLTLKVAEFLGVEPENVLMTNGSDEILNFAFMAFGDNKHPFTFPNLTYGFYPVFAKLNGIPYNEIALNDDFTINVDDYVNIGSNIVIANPNAPTGLTLSLSDIEKIVASNKDFVVIIDEAYIDFGGESCLPLIKKYDNLLITRTFSKSYSLAGARLGYGIGNASLISDLNTIKYSTNPYNVNRMTSAAGVAAIDSASYYMDNCKKIIENREYAKRVLAEMGFFVTDSNANFLFVKHPVISGENLYLSLRKNGILVRHFNKKEISDFNRITIGTRTQIETLLSTIDKILKKEL